MALVKKNPKITTNFRNYQHMEVYFENLGKEN